MSFTVTSDTAQSATELEFATSVFGDQVTDASDTTTALEFTVAHVLNQAQDTEDVFFAAESFDLGSDELVIDNSNLTITGAGTDNTTLVGDLNVTGDDNVLQNFTVEGNVTLDQGGADNNISGINVTGSTQSPSTAVADGGVTTEQVSADSGVIFIRDDASLSDVSSDALVVETQADDSIQLTNVASSEVVVEDSAIDQTNASQQAQLFQEISQNEGITANNTQVPANATVGVNDDGAVIPVNDTGVDAPFSSIQAAINNAPAGATVEVASGTFTQSSPVEVNTTGVTLESTAGPGETTVDDDGTLNDSSETSPVEVTLINASAPNTTVRGLTVDPSTPTQLGIRLTANNTRAINNVVDDPPSDSDTDPGSGGISTSGDAESIIIRDNTVNNAPIAHKAAGPVEITDNTVTGDLVAERFFSFTNPDTNITITGNNFTGASRGNGSADLKFVSSGTTVNGETTAPDIASTTISENDGVDVVKTNGTTFTDADTVFVEKGDGDINDDITAAITTASNFDDVNTVQVAAGTYEQSVTVDVEGLTLEAADGVSPTIAPGDNTDAITVTANNVAIDGLGSEIGVTSGEATAIDLSGLSSGDSVTLENITFNADGAGGEVFVDDAADVLSLTAIEDANTFNPSVVRIGTELQPEVHSDSELTSALDADFDDTPVESGDTFGETIPLDSGYTSGLDGSVVDNQKIVDAAGGTFTQVVLDASQINTDNSFTNARDADAISGAYIQENGQVEYVDVIIGSNNVFFFVPERLQGEDITFAVGNMDQDSGGDYSGLSGNDVVIGNITVAS